ncbi:MAG: AAA family ATPase [Planctomycetes bacterium]|nr:AAA family ATPase [Planctomycetota bacterium]
MLRGSERNVQRLFQENTKVDKGAHFHKCDFQVHSPRDRQWNGTRPSDEAGRQSYAESFIQECRKKGLDAVAITDHHDLVFFSYIKRAAANELDDQGNPIPEEKQIVVFPGMELTLGIPCQALVILDATFPTDMLSTLYTVLAVQLPDPGADQTIDTKQLSDIRSFSQLCEMLDRHDHLKGHYIILPNVTESSGSSLVRKGFHAEYKNMPCLGGYVDGPVSGWGAGIKSIIEGRNREYGFKSIGVIQTSDNRHEDFRLLGQHVSWIKWATPTAEALRQACLAHQTRIFNVEPQIPAQVIQYLDISNSKFLGHIRVEFNSQFNCLIGGRGTGKSTILEYLRWALCDQPPSTASDEDLPNFQAKRASLIENTLIPFEAVVTVGFTVNSASHVVRRNARTKELLLKIGGGTFQPCTEDDVRNLLSVQAYSQKQLSAVGVRNEELMRFVLAPIKQQYAELASRVDDLKSRIRTSYGQLQRKRTIQREIRRDELALESLQTQLGVLRESLKGLSSEDQAILAENVKFQNEEQSFATWDRELEQAREVVRDAGGALARLPSRVAEDAKLTSTSLMSDASQHIEALFRVTKERLREIAVNLEDAASQGALHSFLECQREWDAKHKAHLKLFEAVKEKAASNQATLKQIEKAESESRQLNLSLAASRQRLASQGKPEDEYARAKAEWGQIYHERADLIETKCGELTSLSNGYIKATLLRGAGIDAAKERIGAIIAGTKIRTKKIDELCAHIADAKDSVAEWSQILDEMEALAAIEAKDGEMIALPGSPLLNCLGFTATELQRIAVKLSVDEWLTLSLVELSDIPRFEYRLGEADYIAFEDASAGQQATALLRVLLNQEGPPLIIDQPEEDLDNPVVLEIVSDLWRAKQKRQLIFSSHNANIVVNGDADLVICCGYRSAGDQTKGTVKCEGAIDVEEINKEITAVMEGGKEAFRLRKEKYGF